MPCPLCEQRKPRRACPALGRQICTVCCGTKRLIEITCPSDCPYLMSARTHPPAAVQRRRERDADFLSSIVRPLTSRQYEIFVFVLTTLDRIRPELFPQPVDGDIAEAASALAATHETSERGIIYEHRPTALPAQRVAAALGAALKEMAGHARSTVERDIAHALRQVAEGACHAGRRFDGSPAAFLDLIARVMADAGRRRHRGAEPATPGDRPAGTSLILP